MVLYIKDANYIDWEDLSIIRRNICVEEGKRGGISFIDSLPADNESMVIDAHGRFVTKSFGCGHHHIYSTLARGMPAPAVSPQDFVEILRYVWWHLDKNLDLEMIRASALASALFCAKNGVTFVIDHHASPNACEGSLFVIKDAFDMIGISHLLCYEMSDRDGEEVREAGLAETESFLKAGNQGHVGLHASFTVGDELLKKAVLLAEKYGTGVHVHIAEGLADQEACILTHGRRVIQRIAEAGVLALKGSILGHCIHLNEVEKELLRNSNAWIAENIESNLNNNVGLADYATLGPNIILGTDGMHSDMLRSAKQAFFVGQTTESISYPSIYERFRNIHRYISKHGFSGDSANNLVILDYDSPTVLTSDNFLGHFVFGLESHHVHSVISSGKLIVENRQLLTANEHDILTFAREMGNKLWSKL